jgi:hypothetical protein
MDEIELQYRKERFTSFLKVYSQDEDDPIQEWIFKKDPKKCEYEAAINYVADPTADQHCICTTKIDNECLIQNKETGIKLIIGSVCGKRWLDFRGTCDKCDAVLGNFVKRQKENDWLCRSCKDVGNTLFLGHGPFYSQKFKEVVKNRMYVQFLLNVPVKSENHRKFIEYVNTIWEVE